jgi:lysophospholipase L1-like esterase
VLNRKFGPRFDVRNFGVNGATLLKKGDKPYWNQPQFKELAAFNPRMVVLMLGTNDTKPDNWAHKDEFEVDLNAMLDHFATFEMAPRVLVCLPVPVYEDTWGITSKRLQDEVVPLLKKVAKERNLTVIDLNTALSGHPEMFPDKIHPNAAGATLMAQTVFDAVLNRKPVKP